MQGKRTRARDSRGRPVPGIYIRDGRYSAGFQCPQTGRWRMETLDADTLTGARRERESLIASLREQRSAAPDRVRFADLFAEYQDARTLSERTRRHEQHLANRHLDMLFTRRIQEVTASELARLLRELRGRYSPWTCVAVYRILSGTFALAVRRGVITRSPVDGLAPSERPKQRNKKRVRVLEPAAIESLVNAGSSKRWRTAIGLAGYAGLRLGELRGLRWGDVDLEANLLHVRRSLLPGGSAKAPKTEAGERDVPLLPALRRLLVEWKLEAPHARPQDLIVGTADGRPVADRNLRRALEDAKVKAMLSAGEGERLSWHSLRHSFASMLATDLELPATTLARLTGHSDAGFTLKVYARDERTPETMVKDVLARASGAGIAS